MSELEPLFENNARWAEAIKEEDPTFFEKLSKQQAPEYLWIGCSDARVPANEIVGLLPGDLFVHRNVANVVLHTDLNCLSVIQYAVDVLKVKHILVTGHYGCGGVRASMRDDQLGLIDGWLRSIRDLYYEHRVHLAKLAIAQLRRGFHQPSEQAVGIRRARQPGETAQQGLGIAQRLWHLIEHCGHLRRTHRPARRRHPAWHAPAAAARHWPWHRAGGPPPAVAGAARSDGRSGVHRCRCRSSARKGA